VFGIGAGRLALTGDEHDKSWLLALGAGPTVPEIKRYPTRLEIRCVQCRRRKIVAVFLDKPPRFVCKKCGDRNPIVTTRDRTRQWANQRRGK
jgi:hypothetical protein